MQNAVSIVSTAAAVASREALTAAFAVLDHVIESRNTLPILDNARAVGDGSSLFLIGTNCDQEISVRIPAAADAGFDTTIPAKSFRTLLKGAPKANYVAINTGEDRVTADFETVSYKLPCLPSSDFPEMDGPNETATTFKMAGSDFRAALGKVSGAVSCEETRYYLNGVFFTQNGDEFRMVATDGHRLYLQAMPIPEGMNLPDAGNGFSGVIVPRQTVETLGKLLKGKAVPEEIEFSISESKIRVSFPFEHGFITLTSKLIDGTFPDYTRVIPSCPAFHATFGTADLVEKVKACSLISSERGRAFRLTIDPNGAAIDVNNPDSGSAHAALNCEWDGEYFEIGFNARYILEMLAVLDQETVTFGFNDKGAPVLVKNADGWKGVLMPMRV